jgi:hypothetical protein
MKQYLVICETDMAFLVSEVEKRMNCGWECQGGIGWADPVFMQAMVRVDEEPI